MAEYAEFVGSWAMHHTPPPISVANERSRFDKRPVDIAACARAIRALMPTRKDIQFIRTDDEFIKRFLNARKFNIPDSFELLANYYSYRQRNTHLFANFSANDAGIQQALRDGFPGVLSERDRRGRKVLVLFSDHWDHCSYSLETIYRSLLLTLERLIEVPQNQVNGFVVVVDWSEFSFRQSSNLTPKILRLMIEGLQDCFPAKFKGIHFINQPWYVEAALTVIKPFLKDKTKEKIYLHGNNLSTLHDSIAKDILPAELGGEAPSYNSQSWAEELLKSSITPTIEPTQKEVVISQDDEPSISVNNELAQNENLKNDDSFASGIEVDDVLLKTSNI